MVLPGKFPNLLVNGTVGIAVGMATSLAPHNPTEILDAIVRVVEDPEIHLAELMQDATDAEGKVTRRGVRGPDFPTGGVVHGRGGIIEAYSSGRGKITVRGTIHTEKVGGKASDREQIVVDEIPYMLSQGVLVEKIVEAVKEERITDISDVRNESGRDARSRIVIELKKGADAAVVENQLYQFTPLQQTFSIMNIALVNRQPRTLTLKEMIERYIEHRRDVIRRRTEHLLREAKKRKHILQGLVYAVDAIDEVIKIIRSSSTREEAIERLSERRFLIAPKGKVHDALAASGNLLAEMTAGGDAGRLLSRVQAEAIGGMRLIQLVGLEINRLVEELLKLQAEIEDYEDILNTPSRVAAMIIADCEEMKARYGSDRLTTIEDAAGDINLAALIQVEDMAVTISHAGYAKRVSLSTYRQQGRGGKGIRAADSKDEDFIEHLFVASTHDDLLVFTDRGRVFKMKVYELPEMSRTSKGRALVNLLEFKPGERPCAFLAITDFESGSNYLTFVSRYGIVKRTALKDYRNVHKGGLIAVGLKPGVALLRVELTAGSDDLLLVTAGGMAIRFNEQDVRLMGRTAAGVKGITLEGRADIPDEPESAEPGPEVPGEPAGPPAAPLPAGSDEVIGVVRIPMERDADGDLVTVNRAMALLTVSENGYGKRTLVDEYRVQPETGKARSQSRGGKGRVDINASERNGRSVAAIGVAETDDVVVISKGGQLVRMAASTIRETGRGSQGVRVVKLDESDTVIAIARVAESEAQDESQQTGDDGSGEPA
jgi:DNA gyrase subunit A